MTKDVAARRIVTPVHANDSILFRQLAYHQRHKESQGKRKPLEAPRCSLSIPASQQQSQIRAGQMDEQTFENVAVLAQVRTPHTAGLITVRYLKAWIDQLRWQRLRPFQKLAWMLLDHLDGILNYCKTKVPLGMVEAVNGNIKTILRRGRGYKNLRYLLLKVQRMAATKIELVTFQKAA